MSHWAEIDENNVVIRVLVGDNNDPVGDEGYSWLIENLGGTWVKTSYNTSEGKRVNPETREFIDEPGFRKNYAGIGHTYDETRDAFIPPKPFDSWILNEETCQWKAPIERPEDGGIYTWNESTISWDITE
jgi:hypothetical protein